MRRACLGVLVVWLMFGAGPASAVPPADDGRRIEALARQCVTLIKERRYAEAAALFHYPSRYSRNERRNDAYHVEHNLLDMVGEFGVPEIGAPFNGIAYIYDLGTSAGDRTYWRAHRKEESRTLRYKVRFANVGEGFIEIQVVTFAGRPEVRTVSFGLSALHPHARERIAAIKKRLVAARRARADLTILSGV